MSLLERGTPRRCFLPILALPLVLGACLLGPDYVPPEIALPEKWRDAVEQPLTGQPDNPAEWWGVFADPVLTGLVGEAHQQNLSLQAAGLRIVQSRLGRSMAFQMLFPAVIPQASAARSYYSQEVAPDVDVSFPTIEVQPPKKIRPRLAEFLRDFLPEVTKDGQLDVSISDHVDVYSAALNAIWEPDLFGKTRRRIEAASAEIQAAIGVFDAMLVSLAGEVAFTYIQIRTAQARLAIGQAHIDALKAVQADVAEGHHATAELDGRLVSVALNEAEREQLLLQQVLRESENALCILLALPPQDLSQRLGGPAPIPQAPSQVALGVPADLLRRRPDVRVAERAAAAQCARIGVARVQAIAPSLSLFGSLGVAASDVSDLDKNSARTAAYGAGFGWNILLYPWLVENVRIQDALYEERILLYKDTVLRAAQEVEDAACAMETTRRSLPLVQDAAQAAREAFDRATAGYRSGEVSFPWVLDAIEARLRVEQREAATRGEAALRLVALYKALGGGWEVREGMSYVDEQVKQRMRERTDWWTFTGKHVLEDEILE